jgi:hypothetical protein
MFFADEIDPSTYSFTTALKGTKEWTTMIIRIRVYKSLILIHRLQSTNHNNYVNTL